MNIVSINTYGLGSTGKIMTACMKLAEARGNNVLIYISPEKAALVDNIQYRSISGLVINRIHCYLSQITGLNGCFSYNATKKMIKELNRFNTECIHLHNLHNCYINLPLLFKYIKRRKIRVIWTLHDCWAFTGQCPHFTMAKCNKWISGCYDCPQFREYPKSYVDQTKIMWKLKRKWFTGVQNMTIVTPSQWLANLVNQSFLKGYPVKVINNGIDLGIFKPTASDFRSKYNISNDKYVVLGVAFDWGIRKGLDVFVELSRLLDQSKYQIVLVGTDENIDKQFPNNIISIHRTQDQIELAEIYTAADVFANPTREENYPTVNMESLACGTPVVTFNTGGSPEIIDETCGEVIETNDLQTFFRVVADICENHKFSVEDCVNKAKCFNMHNMFEEYITLYQEITR